MVLHVLGARPNFPKAAPVIEALKDHGVRQYVVHTGQHYDEAMSEVFFRQLGLPTPDVNLAVGSGSHARQTAAIMVGLEEVFEASRPGLVVVYGDVNSTLAASLVAAKLHIPVAHVEAGLRSNDRSMPEEVNRVVTDRLADLLFATSVDAVEHLEREGVEPHRIHLVGNSMIDTVLRNLNRFAGLDLRSELDLPDRYVVATVHRPANVDEPRAVAALVRELHSVAELVKVVVPLHPRGRKRLMDAGLLDSPDIRVIKPLGYLEFLSLVHGAAAVITDSGGVQEETTILGVPCLTLRPNTERPVTITAGTNRLVAGPDLGGVMAQTLRLERPKSWPVPPLWDGKAGARIAKILAQALETLPAEASASLV